MMGSAGRQRHGYVLLLVLFVLALAAAAMAGVCRLSLEKAVQASRAEADLRQRWAVISCRAVLLPRADAVLAQNPTSEVRREIVLSGQSIVLVFGDEQAKANVNLLYAQSGLSGAERETRAVAEAAGASIPVELHPIPDRGLQFGSPDADPDEPPAFESFGQVFGRASAQSLTDLRAKSRSLTSAMTCWGDGAVNLRRASDEAVRAVLTSHLAAGEISRLLDARRKNAGMESSNLLDTLALSDSRREAVEGLLVDDSACYSLWIISDSGDRKQYDLGVAEGANLTVFSW